MRIPFLACIALVLVACGGSTDSSLDESGNPIAFASPTPILVEDTSGNIVVPLSPEQQAEAAAMAAHNAYLDFQVCSSIAMDPSLTPLRPQGKGCPRDSVAVNAGVTP